MLQLPNIQRSLVILSESSSSTASTVPTTTIPSLASIALATATGATSSLQNAPAETGECRLLGPFAILVQAALGLLALTALVFKRWRERPQRPLKIWFFDVSKQIVGSILVHMANLVMSMLSSGQLSIRTDPAVVSTMIKRAGGDYSPNPCSFYLLNLAIDTTVGIPILIFLLHIITSLFLYTEFGSPPESIQSGNYGSPPSACWWLKQSLIYFLGLLGMKFCVLLVFILFPWISRIGDWALGWTEGNEALQVAFVMLVFPLIMNATQYYIIDSFIKNQTPQREHELLPDSDPDEGELYSDPIGGDVTQPLFSDADDDDLEMKRMIEEANRKKRLLADSRGRG
ncbi:hypothetical protein K3495_g6714 [Podosphaera aphanis]|nr:hypothetical protein K3495_g6714 [Podosphaera aphanis]